jgi:ABC-type iron transport system FetAB ATPase subunit
VVHALKMVSLSDELAAQGKGFPSVRQGEFVMIRGPSGGGKGGSKPAVRTVPKVPLARS